MIGKIKRKELIRRRCLRAYSLVELAVAIVILGLLFSMVRPVYLYYIDTAKSDSAADELQEIADKIDQYYKDHGAFPDSLDQVISPPPVDPWGSPYQYLRIDGGAGPGLGMQRKDKNLVPINSDYDLYSSGPDRKSASPLTAKISQDDIVRGRNGAFIGYATDY